MPVTRHEADEECRCCDAVRDEVDRIAMLAGSKE
jgi:hypothetical protein